MAIAAVRRGWGGPGAAASAINRPGSRISLGNAIRPAYSPVLLGRRSPDNLNECLGVNPLFESRPDLVSRQRVILLCCPYGLIEREPHQRVGHVAVGNGILARFA